MWYFISTLDDDAMSWVNKNNYSDYTSFHLYLLSYYFILTTFSTVGYGDISAFTTYE